MEGCHFIISNFCLPIQMPHGRVVHKKVGEDIILPHNMFCINITISNSFSPTQMPRGRHGGWKVV